MNQQEVKPAYRDPTEEKIRRTLAPFLSPSETLRAFAVFTNQPPWLGCLFTSFATFWFRRLWYAATTEQNVYFVKWGFGSKPDPNVLKIPRKDIQLKGNDVIFMVPNASKPRKLYSGVEIIKWGGKFKEDLQNPGNVEIDLSGRFVGEGAGVPQPVSQLDQTPQKTCPKCAEKIQLDALVCRFCGHQFSESEVQAMKQQIDEQAQEARRLADEETARRKAESKKKNRRTWGWVLSILGGLSTAAGGLLLFILIASNFIPSSTPNQTPLTIYSYLCCPLPILLLGLGIMALGIVLIRPKKENAQANNNAA